MAIGVVGGMLGVLFMIPLRRSLIVKEHAQPQVSRGHGVRAGAHRRRGARRAGEDGVHGLRPRRGVQVPERRACTSGSRCRKRAFTQRDLAERTARSCSARSRPRSARSSPASATSSGRASPGYLFAGGVLVVLRAHPGDQAVRRRPHDADLSRDTTLIDDMARERGPRELRLLHRRRRGHGGGAHQPRAHAADHLAGARRRARGLPRHAATATAIAPHRARPADERRRRSARWLCLVAMVRAAADRHQHRRRRSSRCSSPSSSSPCRAASPGRSASSANPVSGMTVATLLLTSLMFLAVGLGRDRVSRARAVDRRRRVRRRVHGRRDVAGPQDRLPRRRHADAYQQIGLLFGVTASALLVGGIIQFLNDAKTTIVAEELSRRAGRARSSRRPVRAGERPHGRRRQKRPARRATASGSCTSRRATRIAGKYLVDDAGAIKYLVDPGSAAASA